MIHVLALALKIIGWILLGILGLFLGILLLVLFSAVCYRIDGTKNGKPEGKVKITWLLRILSVTAAYQDGLSLKTKIFGKTVWKMDPKEKPSDGRPSSQEPSEAPDGFSPEEPLEELPENSLEEPLEEPAEGIYSLETDDGEEASLGEKNRSHSFSGKQTDAGNSLDGNEDASACPDVKAKDDDASGGSTKDGSLPDGEGSGDSLLEEDGSVIQRLNRKAAHGKEKITGFVHSVKEKILSIIRKVRFSIQEICGKLKQIEERIAWLKEKWAMVQDYIHDPANRKSAKLILRQIKKILIHPLPRKGYASIAFGVEDPYQMGQILSAASLAYPFVHKHLTLHPVFGQKLLEGKVHVKGRIRLGVLLGYVLRLLLDKNIRRQLKKLIFPHKGPKGKKRQRAAAES